MLTKLPASYIKSLLILAINNINNNIDRFKNNKIKFLETLTNFHNNPLYSKEQIHNIINNINPLPDDDIAITVITQIHNYKANELNKLQTMLEFISDLEPIVPNVTISDEEWSLIKFWTKQC